MISTTPLLVTAGKQLFCIALYLRPVSLVLRNPESAKKNKVNGDLVQKAATALNIGSCRCQSNIMR